MYCLEMLQSQDYGHKSLLLFVLHHQCSICIILSGCPLSKLSLKYLMYLKEKRDGKVKGRGCADGRPQRLYTDKIETSSPTAALTAIMLTCMIGAFEKRDVATVDIPGVFLQTKMLKGEDDEHVILDG